MNKEEIGSTKSEMNWFLGSIKAKPHIFALIHYQMRLITNSYPQPLESRYDAEISNSETRLIKR